MLPDGGDAVSVAFERLPFVYPDGHHNAEALLVHPTTGALVVVTKADVTAAYALSGLAPDTIATARLIGAPALPAGATVVTDGSVHPCGGRLLLRGKSWIFELRGFRGADLTTLLDRAGDRGPAGHRAARRGRGLHARRAALPHLERVPGRRAGRPARRGRLHALIARYSRR